MIDLFQDSNERERCVVLCVTYIQSLFRVQTALANDAMNAQRSWTTTSSGDDDDDDEGELRKGVALV
jgi:hypothetical protein